MTSCSEYGQKIRICDKGSEETDIHVTENSNSATCARADMCFRFAANKHNEHHEL
jgi:hypothetical protein